MERLLYSVPPAHPNIYSGKMKQQRLGKTTRGIPTGYAIGLTIRGNHVGQPLRVTWLHIKAREYTSRPVGAHQMPWVHIKGRGYKSSPVGTHQGSWVHIKVRGYTSKAASIQRPWVHMIVPGYT